MPPSVETVRLMAQLKTENRRLLRARRTVSRMEQIAQRLAGSPMRASADDSLRIAREILAEMERSVRWCRERYYEALRRERR